MQRIGNTVLLLELSSLVLCILKMSWLSNDVIAWLKSNLAPKKSELKQWLYAGRYFRDLGAEQSSVLEKAYHAIRAGQSFSFEITKADADAAKCCPDTSKRVYHGTSLAAANLII